MHNPCLELRPPAELPTPTWPGLIAAALIALLLLAALLAGTPAENCDPLVESVITGQLQCPLAGSLRSL